MKGAERAAREAVVVEQLDWMRAHDPKAFTKAMELLARLVALARRRRLKQRERAA